MATDVALQQAIQTLRTGDRAAARTMLQTLTETQPSQVDGWLWLAAVSDDVDHKRTYLLRAQALSATDPRVLAALRALDATPAAVLDAQPALTVDAPAAAPVLPAAATLPQHPLVTPRFVTTGVRSRQLLSWQIVALATLMLLVMIPVVFLLVT